MVAQVKPVHNITLALDDAYDATGQILGKSQILF